MVACLFFFFSFLSLSILYCFYTPYQLRVLHQSHVIYFILFFVQRVNDSDQHGLNTDPAKPNLMGEMKERVWEGGKLYRDNWTMKSTEALRETKTINHDTYLA